MMLVQLPAIDAVAVAVHANVPWPPSAAAVAHALARPSVWLALLATLVVLASIRAALVLLRPPVHKAAVSLLISTTTTEKPAAPSIAVPSTHPGSVVSGRSHSLNSSLWRPSGGSAPPHDELVLGACAVGGSPGSPCSPRTGLDTLDRHAAGPGHPRHPAAAATTVSAAAAATAAARPAWGPSVRPPQYVVSLLHACIPRIVCLVSRSPFPPPYLILILMYALLLFDGILTLSAQCPLCMKPVHQYQWRR